MEIQNKMSSVTEFVISAVLNIKATQIENKTPDITNLAKKAALNNKAAPLDEAHLFVVRGLIHQEVSHNCINDESSTERRRYNCQVNISP